MIPELSREDRSLLRWSLGSEDTGPRPASPAPGVLDEAEGPLRALLPLLRRHHHPTDAPGPTELVTTLAHEEVTAANRALLASVGASCGVLREAEIGGILGHDAAAAIALYPDVGLRPVPQAEVLVPRPSARQAVALLLDHGWSIAPGPALSDLLAIGGGVTLTNPAAPARKLGLLWHAVVDDLRPDADEALLRRSRQWEPTGCAEGLFVPSLTDHLLLVCARAATLGVPSLQWRVDAAMILQPDRDTVDWDLLVGSAQDRALGWLIAAVLESLVADLGITVPDGTMAQLRSHRPGRARGWYAQHRISPSWGRIDAPARFIARHQGVVSADRGPIATLQLLPAHLRVTRSSREADASTGPQMNGQIARRVMVRRLADAMPFEYAVETGTFRGDTTVFLADTLGCDVWTVEVDPGSAASVRRHLVRRSDLHLHEGDSRAFIGDLAPRLRSGRTFFYLDAHWNADLPLWGEIALILDAWDDPVILIDDFAVPDDEGYGYDDYGPGQVLDRDHLAPLLPEQFSYWWPTTPSWVETGGTRGCVVVARDDHREVLKQCLLRPGVTNHAAAVPTADDPSGPSGHPGD